MSKYRTAPVATTGMPKGIPYIISNEAAERFSFYGMKSILVIFMTKYMLDSHGQADYMSDAQAKTWFHAFNTAVYFFPILGAILCDRILGKYKTILWLSMVYCFGHFTLAIDETRTGLMVGLILIAVGAGGIKPCVSAHVGDQFGKSNHNLLEKVFLWFYFSINLGAAASTVLTPWLLRNYGPAWAFGVPGVLMALATVFFWMGRNKFIHIPAGGAEFIKEVFSRKGLGSLGKLFVIYLFVAMFWSLFDQTGSAWVLQADKMDRNFMGIEWLPSQFQVVNPIMIMIFIPLFSYIVYPAINRVFPLTPIRKIAIGFFVTVPAFAIPAWIEAQIVAGEVVNIGWQLLAYAIITAAEVFISITCLEFSYTQAPKKMKSFVMACFLMSVAVGNVFVTGVNFFIQNPAPTFEADVPGEYALKLTVSDGTHTVTKTATVEVITEEKLEALEKADDAKRKGKKKEVEKPAVNAGRDIAVAPGKETNLFLTAREGDSRGDYGYSWRIKSKPKGSQVQLTVTDRRYTTITPDVEGAYVLEAKFNVGTEEVTDTVMVMSTKENLPPVVKVALKKRQLVGEDGIQLNGGGSYDLKGDKLTYAWEVVSAPKGSVIKTANIRNANQATTTVKLEGEDYYWFFSIMMLITAILFIPYARRYQPQTYIQDEETA